MEEILRDLAEEQRALERVLEAIEDPQWELPTPAQGWSVKDSVSHIAHIDEVASMILDGDLSPIQQARDMAVGYQSNFNEIGVKKGRSMTPREVLGWWKKARESMMERLWRREPKERIPWFVMPMSARAFATARLMETWAHGLDCRDGLGVIPEDTDRLRHVALLACLARPWAYQVNGLEPPKTPLRVELVLPSGTLWFFGPEDAPDRIEGLASEFCRVAVRRLHYLDTSLVARGTEAQRFLEIAVAYAGSPGPGRKPKGGVKASGLCP